MTLNIPIQNSKVYPHTDCANWNCESPISTLDQCITKIPKFMIITENKIDLKVFIGKQESFVIKDHAIDHYILSLLKLWIRGNPLSLYKIKNLRCRIRDFYISLNRY